MDKAHLKEFVQCTAMLWNEHKKREALYVEAMKKDDLGSLRRVCNQGHISALLFQKEIQWVYDYFKCMLNDCDLRENTIKSNTVSLDRIEDRTLLARLLKDAEYSTIHCYQKVLKFLDKDSEEASMMHEHIARLSDLYEVLAKEVGTRQSWGSAAPVGAFKRAAAM
ncbi:hypothetical protein [Telluribacter humicola]|uniref:hypothetical protein n=1 Tax=Telluribacter humicola TaxID=1720261 RepID=UPI001A96C276|nr:hypothetical protein [Telluribacter humicola]